jgi:MOSC domain-containing protein YiiM
MRFSGREGTEIAMWQGALESIHIASQAAAPLQSLAEVLAIPGVGLEGDRYALKQGTFFKQPDPSVELTLIEAEAIEAAEKKHHLKLAPGETRRNLVTRGVPLNDLIGIEFRIGEVRVRGIRLSNPCSYLQRLTGKDVMQALRNRGGLRAQILSQGIVRVGDSIFA